MKVRPPGILRGLNTYVNRGCIIAHGAVACGSAQFDMRVASGGFAQVNTRRPVPVGDTDWRCGPHPGRAPPRTLHIPRPQTLILSRLIKCERTQLVEPHAWLPARAKCPNPSICSATPTSRLTLPILTSTSLWQIPTEDPRAQHCLSRTSICKSIREPTSG